MSGVGKSIKKGFKKIGGWIKDNWKPIVAAAAITFTGGLATIGFSGFSSAVSSMGLWKAAGSTMWAGATSLAGTFGLGSGASGAAAAGAGMQGATLLTGAGAQGLGMASSGGLMGPPTQAGMASSGVGTYTGPGSSFMGGGGSLFGGGAQPRGAGGMAGGGGSSNQQIARQLANQPGSNLTERQILAAMGGDGGGLGRSMAIAAVPSLMQAAGGYFATRAEEEARKPKALWGVDMKTGLPAGDIATAQGPEQQGQGYMPWDPNQGGGGLMAQSQPRMNPFVQEMRRNPGYNPNDPYGLMGGGYA